MKRTLIIAALILLCISCSGERKKSAEVYYDFRSTRWGMSIGEVREAETGTYIGKVDPKSNGGGALSICDILLEYKDRAFDLDCSILYGFIGGKLVNAQYKIPTPYSLLEYYDLKQTLAMKFKTLQKEKYSFENRGGEAYKMNKAIFVNKNTDLTLTAIYPKNLKPKDEAGIRESFVNIGYSSKLHRELLEAKEEKVADLGE